MAARANRWMTRFRDDHFRPLSLIHGGSEGRAWVAVALLAAAGPGCRQDAPRRPEVPGVDSGLAASSNAECGCLFASPCDRCLKDEVCWFKLVGTAHEGDLRCHARCPGGLCAAGEWCFRVGFSTGGDMIKRFDNLCFRTPPQPGVTPVAPAARR